MRAGEATSLLRIDGLDAGYGEVQVLRNVSFAVEAGEILAVVGANGAGKTTLLRALSGLVRATRGRMIFDGHDLARATSAEIVRLGVSHAPEGRRLFSGMTVEENLRLGAFGRADKSRGAVAGSLERVFTHFPRLRERRRQLAGTLSGGEQQMCAIGRALMAGPRLLIIDELSLGLAPVVIGELLDILHEIHAAGTTILLVEQDLAVALAFADRAIVLQTGSVALAGAAAELLKDEQMIRIYLGGSHV